MAIVVCQRLRFTINNKQYITMEYWDLRKRDILRSKKKTLGTKWLRKTLNSSVKPTPEKTVLTSIWTKKTLYPVS